MIFLDVLPALIVYLVIFAGGTLLAHITRAGKPMFPYLWRALITSTVGIMSANAVLWMIVATVGSILTLMNPSDVPHQIVPTVIEFFLHSIPASLVGCIVGIATGVAWGYLASRRPRHLSRRPNLAA